MTSMPTRKKAMVIGALEGDISKLEASSSRASEKQDRAALEAQIAQLQKEKEEDRATLEARVAQLQKEKDDMKSELDQLRSEKEAAENNFNLGEAEGKVNELQMCKAARKCTRPFDAQLLQAIPNEVTLNHICTKLPWSAFHYLSSVNRCWREAIQSRRVYDARVHAQSTETLVCVTRAPCYELWSPVKDRIIEDLKDRGFEAMIGLYSLIGASSYKLPQIPNLDTRSIHLGAGGLPSCCQCLSLDGKIYVLGGTENPDCDEFERDGSAEVYVLDVAGQRPWKQVASMHEARMDFAACVMDGRIYVFGGRSLDKPVHGCEVYDPEVDKWSPITPMTSLRFRHKVAVHGEELVMFDGEFYVRVNEADGEVAEYENDARIASDFEVYHPAKNEWRVTHNLGLAHYDRPTFTANGKSYLMDWRGIYSLDDDRGFSWTMRRENSFPNMGAPTHHFIEPCVAAAVNDEVLAIVQFISESNGEISDEGTSLFQSIGFNGEDKKTGPGGAVKSVKWQKLNCSLPLDGMLQSGTMLRIQL